ncbi:hypothetical protein SO802_001380 [Lithocarpus litseifolius]|uniref:DUF4283 domain-containing protein n=1 Tax=Lithocarpus litseifolius TaxID=425828 RepID=A0AAW2DZF3_9ROSI
MTLPSQLPSGNLGGLSEINSLVIYEECTSRLLSLNGIWRRNLCRIQKPKYFPKVKRRPSRASESSMAVWIRLPELPFEYYEGSVLREIESVIRPVLLVDTHIASETRGQYARLCVQINLGKPLVRLLHIGKLDQLVLYEGLNFLCVSCGRVDHRTESCPYTVRSPEGINSTRKETDATGDDKGAKPNAGERTEPMSEAQEGSFGTWMLVTRKKKDKGQQQKEGAHFSSFTSTRESSPTRSLGFTTTSPNQKDNGRATCDKFVGHTMMERSLFASAPIADRTHNPSSKRVTRDERNILRGSTGAKNQKLRTDNTKHRVSRKPIMVDKGNPTQKWESYQGKGGWRCQGF